MEFNDFVYISIILALITALCFSYHDKKFREYK